MQLEDQPEAPYYRVSHLIVVYLDNFYCHFLSLLNGDLILSGLRHSINKLECTPILELAELSNSKASEQLSNDIFTTNKSPKKIVLFSFLFRKVSKDYQKIDKNKNFKTLSRNQKKKWPKKSPKNHPKSHLAASQGSCSNESIVIDCRFYRRISLLST